MAATSQAQFSEVYDRLIVGDDFFEGAEYYRNYKDRYWNTLCHVQRFLPARGGRLLDIGSGQFAVLGRQLLGVDADVADIDTRYTAVLARFEIGFQAVDLSIQSVPSDRPYDVIVMAEVIEHVPTPPYVVFENLAAGLKPGGHLIVTTPNLYRLRNALRMLLGKPIFDLYRIPEKDAPLGHFIEYAKDQMDWHLERAGMRVVHSELEQLSLGGSSKSARVARKLLRPVLSARPLWRDSMVVVGQKPV